MKMLAETKGDFMFLDLSVGQRINSHRPSVVVVTDFLNARIGLGHIIKVADVPDEATDEEFEAYWKESEDRNLALAAFLSKFDTDAAMTTAPRVRRVAK